MKGVRTNVLEHIDILAKFTGTDIFLLNPQPLDPEDIHSSYGNGTENGLDQRLRISIYGDPESSEHAKTRVLIMIDQIVCLHQLDRSRNLLTMADTAQTYGGCDEVGALPAHDHLRSNAEEHPTDRVRFQYSHLLPTTISTCLWIHATWRSSKRRR